MQHGALTPLGRQLRAVLANLSSAPIIIPRNRAPTHAPSEPPRHGARTFSRALPRPSQAAATTEQLEFQSTLPPHPTAYYRSHSERRREKRGISANEHLTEALNDTGNAVATPKSRPWKLNLSYVDPKSKNIWRDYDARMKRFLNTPPAERPRPRMRSLQRITSHYIRLRATLDDNLAAEEGHHFQLTAKEEALLRRHRYTLEDVAAWAGIVSAQNSLNAAKALSDRFRSVGPYSVPIWLLMYLLRRPYLSARALRILMKCTSDVFEHQAKRSAGSGRHTGVVFIAAMRLIRHAREVWPQAVGAPVNIMLQHLRDRELSNGPFSNSELSNITYLLNKLMQLVSISTAHLPFKDNLHQEAALVPVLQYMAERSPPLQINRQGYRAVVRIQLMQRKTAEEQQWAELKSLAWPPWKVDRTAMDTAIGPEQGISRAGATLARMREAGYRPLYWEKLAEVYTGWDVDRTPTIQLRALLRTPGFSLSTKFRGSSEPWAARIQSTRTIQEAWACYLAWEDKKLPPDQDVYLAVFNKLYEEERRQRKDAAESRFETHTVGYWPLTPGDIREISPPPPSTHLETYTKTEPPTVTSFYQMLVDREIALEADCVAFAIHHATFLQEGLERLQTAISRYSAAESLLSLQPSENILKVPEAIFAATVGLYAQSTRTSLSQTLAKIGHAKAAPDTTSSELFPGFHLNYDNPMIHAMQLLRLRPFAGRAAWNLLAHRLTRESKYLGLSNAMKPRTASIHSVKEAHSLSKDHQRYKGAMNAFRLVYKVVDLQRENHVDLDTPGFDALSRVTDHAVTAWWNVLQHDEASKSHAIDHELHMLWRDAKNMGQARRAHSERLKHEFRTLVGGDEVATHSQEQPEETMQREPPAEPADLPKLLTVPNPNSLHLYIRALGWLADFDGLLALVHWMREYRAELSERRSRDRQGARTMRRAITALRVFLERSWIRDAGPALDPDDVGQYEGEDEKDQAAAILTMIRSSANPELIEEVRDVVESVKEWGGWPSDEEVEAYAADKRFQPFRGEHGNEEPPSPEPTSSYRPLWVDDARKDVDT